ncbi:transposase [Clostridium sporogenes]|uniref:transposase n=1 Tax=Clostridium sporogenes TaxID=1509 RepID=UPI0013D804B7|nr:transposase [Clostridium sporogenes]NFH40742.1 transposase [Clostridium sporogenes]
MARSQTPSYVLTLPLKTTISDISALEKYFELSRKYYNAILGKLNNRVKIMQESREFNKLRKLPEGKERTNAFKNLEKKYGLRGTAINKLITSLRTKSKDFKVLGSHITIQLQLRAMQSINKVRFEDGKQIHFIRYNEMTSIQGSNNEQSIRYRDGIVEFKNLRLPVIIKNNDVYAQKAIQDRVKFCRILRRFSKNKTKYYVQLCLEGIPPKKKHELGKGEVGLDIGTQTIAIVSDNITKLLELAPSINRIDKEKRVSLRKLDRQRRANNPNKYNKDGTIKKGNRDKWVKSNNYLKTQSKLRDIQRRISNKRKQEHDKLANYILSLGNIIKVETMNYKGLQKRNKNTEKNNKGKFKKKKRFGKSLSNKSPSMLLTILNKKLKYNNEKLYKIDTKKCKASQYNHFTDKYNKKELKDRWNKDINIQRDLYSAFLIMNTVGKKLDKIDRDKCIEAYDNFKILHDKEISRLKKLKKNGYKLISSMGI